MKHFERSRAMCEWSELPAWDARIRALLAADVAGCVSPFHLLSLPGFDAADQKRCAELWMRERLRASSVQRHRWALSHPPAALRAPDSRIRLGYLSNDFREHATALLLIETIEAHDRQRFEVSAYSYGADDDRAMRRRLRDGFEHFHCIDALSTEDAASAIRADGIDILIDLKGYTHGTRSSILSYRPAPVQVSYLGYPGTLGGELCDYLITDPYLTPPATAGGYSEALAYLPDSYQPHRRAADIGRPLTRAAAGLPAQGFVFACFNQAWKITPAIFDLWCTLLDALPDAVLWLLDDELARGSLRREALMRGVDPARLVFAPPLPQAEHLARLQLADLALDTLPYNAHTTASDALWVGVPLISCTGSTFASRVAGSLLNAVGMDELITADPAAYCELALAIALDPVRLRSLKQRLIDGRTKAALYNVVAYTHALEALYETMHSRQRQGLSPRAIGAGTGR